MMRFISNSEPDSIQKFVTIVVWLFVALVLSTLFALIARLVAFTVRTIRSRNTTRERKANITKP